MSMDHSHPGGFTVNTTPPQPAAPTFTPNDRFVEAGDCRRLGHVYLFSSSQQNWRCAACQHVAPAGRPAPQHPTGLPMYPMPEMEPLRIQPAPYADPVRLMLPTRQPGVIPMLNPPGTVIPMANPPARLPVGAGQRCLFLDLPESERGKAMGLHCPCPAHSAWC